MEMLRNSGSLEMFWQTFVSIFLMVIVKHLNLLKGVLCGRIFVLLDSSVWMVSP